ncbi:hypothetical protein DDR56_09865 [Halomonas venusta]|uniref:Uncharacterized protein n=2 Tax=Vreelandella venusta TaxID=44935 RepID=A0ABX2B9Q7_9GAMM|nr:hypothetical protein [Halomonas venusta]
MEDDYRGSAQSAVVADGELAHTHIALLNLDKSINPQPCYVKFYPDELAPGQEHRGLVNEIVGHIIAHEVGACVPDSAGLIFIPPSHLASCPEWASHDEGELLVGWWSQDMAYPSLKAHYNIPSKPTKKHEQAILAAIEELASSPDVHDTIALDNLLANTDRNIGNLLRKVRGRYVLIDHGCCLTGESWLPGSLDPHKKYENKVILATRPASDQWRFKSATLKSHDSIVEQLDEALETLKPWLKHAVNSEDVDAIDHFLRERGSPGCFAKQIGLVV